MSVTIQPLIQSQQIANAFTAYFTAAGYTRVDAMTLYNPRGNAAELVTIEWVPSGGATGAASIIVEQNCLAGVPYNVFALIGQTLAPGDKIYAKGAAGNLVNLFASGTVTS